MAEQENQTGILPGDHWQQVQPVRYKEAAIVTDGTVATGS